MICRCLAAAPHEAEQPAGEQAVPGVVGVLLLLGLPILLPLDRLRMRLHLSIGAFYLNDPRHQGLGLRAQDQVQSSMANPELGRRASHGSHGLTLGAGQVRELDPCVDGSIWTAERAPLLPGRGRAPCWRLRPVMAQHWRRPLSSAGMNLWGPPADMQSSRSSNRTQAMLQQLNGNGSKQCDKPHDFIRPQRT